MLKLRVGIAADEEEPYGEEPKAIP